MESAPVETFVTSDGDKIEIATLSAEGPMSAYYGQPMHHHHHFDEDPFEAEAAEAAGGGGAGSLGGGHPHDFGFYHDSHPQNMQHMHQYESAQQFPQH